MNSLIVTAVVVPWLQAFAMALVPILFGLGLALLRKHQINTQWYEAIGRAGGAAYNAVLTSGAQLDSKAALAVGAKAGADYLAARVPGIVAARDLDPAALAQIAGAQLGTLLAVDPTVKA